MNNLFKSFRDLDIRVGTIIRVERFEEAIKPSYKLKIDFGELGFLKSSAQITKNYTPEQLLGFQVIAIVNFPKKQIANFMSECLVLGVVVWMAFPYIDRNPETHPSKRKFAIMFYTFFLAGAGVLTLIGVLFRGPGWNWTYPWIDGIWFDDLLDWIHFE